jgi:metal-responsive CopG/Arc/MetJ family transcriptional regulator
MSEKELKTARVPVLVTRSWLAAVDEWRERQPDRPNRSEAIRRLVERGIDEG